jgi:hypothetical protein
MQICHILFFTCAIVVKNHANCHLCSRYYAAIAQFVVLYSFIIIIS